MRRVLSLITVMILAVTLLTGCTAPVESVSQSVTTVDTSAAMTSTLPDASTAPVETTTADPMRVISTVPSATEILFAMGAGDQIVGVDVSSTFPEEANAIEKVGDYNGFDVEKIISLEPDVVFVGQTIQDDQIAQLENAGIRTVEVEARAFADMTDSIRLIGEEIDHQVEAEAMVVLLEEKVAAVEDAAATLAASPTVYYVMGIGEYGNWTSGEGSFINDMIEISGGTCVTADAKNAWIEYPLEDLLLADPDILIVSSYVSLEELYADPTYAELSAVKAGNVFAIDADLVERPGPRILDGLQLISEIILNYQTA